MSIWMEVRCELMLPSEHPYRESDKCYSAVNHGPMTGAFSTQKSVLEQFKFLERDAKRNGWVKANRNTWICPVCAKKKETP